MRGPPSHHILELHPSNPTSPRAQKARQPFIASHSQTSPSQHIERPGHGCLHVRRSFRTGSLVSCDSRWQRRSRREGRSQVQLLQSRQEEGNLRLRTPTSDANGQLTLPLFQKCMPRIRIWPAKCDRCREKSRPCEAPGRTPTPRVAASAKRVRRQRGLVAASSAGQGSRRPPTPPSRAVTIAPALADPTSERYSLADL